jgi:hypothetical protein
MKNNIIAFVASTVIVGLFIVGMYLFMNWMVTMVSAGIAGFITYGH